MALSALALVVALLALARAVATDIGHRRASAERAKRLRIRDAFEHAPDEGSLERTTGRILAQELAACASEVLLTDPETGGLRQIATGQDDPGCGVGTLDGCPAIRRGTSITAGDPSRYDACPELLARSPAGRTAVCVPVTAHARQVGVVHVLGPVGRGGRPTRDDVEPIAQELGARVGVLRAIAADGRKQARDPLTGLLDRRGIDGRARQLDAADAPYSVAYIDLDQFKLLNDTNGNAAGDRVLRRFAMVLTDALRPHDHVSRWDADGFVVVLPHTIVTDARIAIERVRETLARELLDAHLPRFTFSSGIAAVDRAEVASFDEALAHAERAWRVARSVGSDRIVLATDELVGEAERAGLLDDDGAAGRGSSPTPAGALFAQLDTPDGTPDRPSERPDTDDSDAFHLPSSGDPDDG